MKQYLITEEKLKEMLISTAKAAIDEDDPIIDDDILAFKLAHNPVEEIASFKPSFVMENIAIDCHTYIGQSIKIYLQKENQ
jgi:hypothetical protein